MDIFDFLKLNLRFIKHLNENENESISITNSIVVYHHRDDAHYQ